MPGSVLDMARGVHLLVGTATALAAAGLLIWTLGQVRAEQQEVQAWVVEQRTEQVELATREFDGAFADVAQDLELMSEAVALSGEQEVEEILTALLAVARPYRLALLVDREGEPLRRMQDPRQGEVSDALVEEVLATARLAAGAEERVFTSMNLTDGDAWYRVFARPLEGGGSLALLVDTRPMLQPLLAVTADRSTELLVLGPHGLPVPVSSPRLAEGADAPGLPAFAGVLAAMRGGGRGNTRLPAAEAVALGFPDADLLAVWMPIATGEGPHWSAGAFVSTRDLGSSKTLGRVMVGGLGGATLLLLLVVYVARVARRDVQTTERLRHALAEGRLRERAELLLDHVPSWVLALGDDLRLVTANHASTAALGLASGMAWAELFPAATPEVRQRLEGLLRKAVATGEVQRLVGPLHLLDELGSFDVRAVPIQDPLEDERALLVIDDTSALRRLQDQLVRAEKLSTVGVLAAGIAHEVGTPLGVIRGRAEYAAEKLGDDHPQTAGLQVIVGQIDRIVRVISALLDFASPRSVERHEVDVRATVEGVSALVGYELQRRKQRLTVSVPDGVRVAGDADQLQQILVNLVMNAIHASEAGGEVRLSAGIDGEAVRLAVEDDGAGIAETDLPRVFDPFFTTKKRGVGTGLGLAVVHQIARAHGGSVQLTSELGSGTRVEVVLPHAGTSRS